MWDSKYKKMWDSSNDGFLETVFECLKQQLAFDDRLKVFEKIAYNHQADGRVFMQCAGLKDKKGTLIYEDDIVEINMDEKCIVLWDEDDASFWLESTATGERYPFYRCEIIKVLGNIYENPELLGDM